MLLLSLLTHSDSIDKLPGDILSLIGKPRPFPGKGKVVCRDIGNV
jgi:hypothetical protein